MKEKLFKKGFKKRLFSVVLALAMVFSLLQGQNLVVYAATENSFTITAESGTTSYQPTTITVSCGSTNSNGIACMNGYDVTVSVSGDNIITKIEAAVKFKHFQGNPVLSVTAGSLPSNYSTSEGSVITISDINASSVTISNTDTKMLGFESFVVYYKDSSSSGTNQVGSATIQAISGETTYTEAPITVSCGSTNSNGIACMNGYDVTVSMSGDNIISRIEATVKFKHFQGNPVLSVTAGSLPNNYSTSEGSVITISDINASSVTISNTDTKMLGFESFVVYYKSNLPHNHDFAYSASDSTLTATCSADDCDLTDNKVSLTLTASSANYSGSPATITLEGIDAWGKAKIDVPEIKYFKGSEALIAAPTTPGNYTAKISAGDPAVTASVDFTISVAKNEAETVSANNVVSKINEIGTVEYTDACKAKIDAARTAYNALAEHLRSLVTNYNVLTTAEAKYVELKAAAEKLEADTLAANAVDTLIKAIGTVDATDACKAKIDAARKAYDALTADQKKLVKELKTLEDAEKAYEALKPAPTPSPDPTPAPTPIPVPAPEAIELGTSYDTIQTTETVTSKGKVTGITISANSISMNGILTVNANLKVTILDGKWSVAGYSEDRVTPATLNAVKWLAADGTKKDAKTLKKYAKSKYYKATSKKGAKTLITAGLNKKDIDGVYAVKLVDDQGHTIVLNIECTKLVKISKKDALKITEAGKSVSANDIITMADGESVKTINLSFAGKDKNVSKSSFNNNAIVWKVGTGKKALTIKCGEVTEYKTKKGDVIGYLTVTEDGSVKVLAGSVKGKLSLSATLYGKVYKTSVSIKK